MLVRYGQAMATLHWLAIACAIPGNVFDLSLLLSYFGSFQASECFKQKHLLQLKHLLVLSNFNVAGISQPHSAFFNCLFSKQFREFF